MRSRTTQSDTIPYHLHELAIALDPADPRHSMPLIEKGDRAILEIGCGIGQLFAASGLGRHVLAVGIDVDSQALRYGKERFGDAEYVEASGESLPFRDGSVDLVVSRVSLPYTNIPDVVKEAARVLRPGGRVWLSLYPFSMVRDRLTNDVRRLKVKDFILTSYIVLNGLLLHSIGRVVPFAPSGAYESFQTNRGMRMLLRAAGFRDIVLTRTKHFVVTAVKG
jgi:ubiquinone/menaquinone biosynthesis C-methylase UbiE